MSSIILAYIVGVLCGVGYMYLRYGMIMRKHMRELEQLKLNSARIEGQLNILRIVKGVEEDKPDVHSDNHE